MKQLPYPQLHSHYWLTWLVRSVSISSKRIENRLDGNYVIFIVKYQNRISVVIIIVCIHLRDVRYIPTLWHVENRFTLLIRNTFYLCDLNFWPEIFFRCVSLIYLGTIEEYETDLLIKIKLEFCGIQALWIFNKAKLKFRFFKLIICFNSIFMTYLIFNSNSKFNSNIYGTS